jgi:hypothetical protein
VAGFSAFLADASGEVVERVGENGYMTSAVAFAAAYAEVWHATPPDARDALAEHNADGLVDAAADSEKAAAILAALHDAPASVSASPSEPVAIAVVVTAGKPDLKGYLDAMRAAAAAQTADTFRGWEALQRPVIVTLSQVTRRSAEKIVADRATALGIDKPPPRASEPAHASAPSEQEPDPVPLPDSEPQDGTLLTGEATGPAPWGRSAQSLIDDMDACRSIHDLTALANNAATAVKLRQIKEADPDEHGRLLAYAAARRAALTPKAGG